MSDTPKEGETVMIKFFYANTLTESPATYKNGNFIVSFYTSEFPATPTEWRRITEAERYI